MHHRLLVTLAIVLVALPACAPAPRPVAAAGSAPTLAIAGCYALTVGEWSIASRMGPPVRTTAFRLDTAPGGARGTAFAASRLAPRDTTDVRAPRWHAFARDSLLVHTWHTGTESEGFYGRRVGRELRGVMRLTSDAIPVDSAGRIMWEHWPWAPAVARPIPCPAVP